MVWGSQPEYQAYQTLIDSFHTQSPTTMLTSLARQRRLPPPAGGGLFRRQSAGRDALELPPDRTLADEGALAPVGPYLANSTVFKETDFYQPPMEAFRYKGDLWCLPQNVSSLAVYYNKALFDAKGLAYPADDWTLDDFEAAAKARH